MKQCPGCGRKNYHEKYCPVCHYYLGNVKEESNLTNYVLPITVECPYCHSTNTKKITTSEKIFDTVGTKRFKEWHCNHCDSNF
ncbi:hypothetical protein AALB16_10750 [Lachnospiraceae bacterium 62-35]